MKIRIQRNRQVFMWGRNQRTRTIWENKMLTWCSSRTKSTIKKWTYEAALSLSSPKNRLNYSSETHPSTQSSRNWPFNRTCNRLAMEGETPLYEKLSQISLKIQTRANTISTQHSRQQLWSFKKRWSRIKTVSWSASSLSTRTDFLITMPLDSKERQMNQRSQTSLTLRRTAKKMKVPMLSNKTVCPASL